jgi:formylaminopyrimidine deformylase
MQPKRTRVLDKIEELRDQAMSTLTELVQIPSISPNYPGVVKSEVLGGEGECSRAMARHYQDIGCQVDVWEEEPRRANAVGIVKGAGSGKSLIFNGHVDTVPPGDSSAWKWGNPYSGRLEEGRVYGLGTCDMKGGIVAAFIAAKALVECGIHLQGDLLLESVVGEETMDHEAGTTATIKRGHRADAAIVVEPTVSDGRLMVAPVSPGLFFMKVNCTGVPSHPGIRYQFIRAGGKGESAGVNAIEKGVKILTALQELENQWGISKTHALFPPGYFVLHPGVFVGGPTGQLVPYIVSDYCRIEYVVWYPPQEAPETIRAEIEDYIAKAAAMDPWLAKNRPTVEWINNWPAYEIPVSHPLTQTCLGAITQVDGQPAAECGTQVQAILGVTDATFFNRAGIPALTCGPGSGMAHKRDEYISVDEMMFAAKTFALTAMDWCGVA